MRILFVSDSIFNPIIGGIERVTDILTRRLSETHSVFYLCEPTDNPKFLNYDYPARVFFLPEVGGYSNSTNQAYYLNILKKNNIDVVVNQRGWAPYFNCMIDGGTPVISVVHSVPDAFVRYNMNNLFRHDNTAISLLKYCFKLLSYPLYTTEKRLHFKRELKKHFQYLFIHSSAVIFLSEEYVYDSKKLLSPIKSNCFVGHIPNPTTLPALYSMKRKEKIILYVGRLTKNEKRPDRLLKVWSILYKNFPEWKLIFVGDGDYKCKLETYVFKKSMKNVYFVGATQDVGSYYAEASIVCLTSDFEGWGMALTEGMSYGCIPLTFNNYGAARDIIDDGVNGYLIKPFCLRQYAERLTELMSNDLKRNEMSENAKLKSEKFAVGAVCDMWNDLFRWCLHKDSNKL